MRMLSTLGLSLLLAATASATASAHWQGCQRGIAAVGRMANGLNFDPPRRYDTQWAARHRAIAAWRQRVAASCPRHSTFWWRAHDKRVDCEGYAGGIACVVRAAPARKLFLFGAAD